MNRRAALVSVAATIWPAADVNAMAPDPPFAAIAHWRPLPAALISAMVAEKTEEDRIAVDAAFYPAMAVLSEIYQSTPSTAAGLLTVMEIMLEHDGEQLGLVNLEPGADDADRGLATVFANVMRLLEARS